MKERDLESMSRAELVEEIEDLEARIEDLERDLAVAEDVVSLESASDEDLEAEYRSRGLGFDEDDLRRMFDAFYLGNQTQAVEIAKRVAEQATGRYL